MGSRDLKLEFWKNKLADLEQDYKTVEAQLRTEQDGPTQNKLTRQLVMLEEEIKEYEQKITACQQECQRIAALAPGQAMLQLVQEYDDQFEQMRRAFQAVLKNWSYRIKSAIQAPLDIVRELMRIPQGESLHTALEEFGAYLLSEAANQDLVAALQDWGQQYGKQWFQLVAQITQSEEEGRVQPALLISIDRSDEASTQAQEETYYRLKAFHIHDVQQYKGAKQGYSLIQVPGMTGDAVYAWEDLCSQVQQVLAHFLAESSSQQANEPEIHVFLPFELMNLDIDCWCPAVPYGRPQPIGHRYKVFLRSQERVSRSYVHRGIWEQKWQQHLTGSDKLASDVFMTGNDADLDELYDALEEIEAEIVGLKVTQAPCQFDADGLFGAVLQAGLPLAIWGRCDLSHCSNEEALDQVLQAGCLSSLPTTVQEKRREARRVRERDQHIGYHLSLLWDDPALVPPKSA